MRLKTLGVLLYGFLVSIFLTFATPCTAATKQVLLECDQFLDSTGDPLERLKQHYEEKSIWKTGIVLSTDGTQYSFRQKSQLTLQETDYKTLVSFFEIARIFVGTSKLLKFPQKLSVFIQENTLADKAMGNVTVVSIDSNRTDSTLMTERDRHANMHELGHVILSTNLLTRLPGMPPSEKWSYFEELVDILLHAAELKSETSTSDKITESMMLKRALHITTNLMGDTTNFQKITEFHSPYQELFADLFSEILLGIDGHKSSRLLGEREKLRDFNNNEAWREEWELPEGTKNHDYVVTAPTRNFLWTHFLSKPLQDHEKLKLLDAVFLAIEAELNKALLPSTSWLWSSFGHASSGNMGLINGIKYYYGQLSNR